MTTVVRPASAADRPAIVEVFWACWTISYGAALPAELVSRLGRVDAEALWDRALDDPAAAAAAAVAVGADGRVIGLTRWSGDTVQSLYVHPESQRGGAGRRLLTHATDQIAAVGFEVAHLWVFDGNRPALTFYERQGWILDGTTRTDAAFGHPELRLRKDLQRS